MSAIYKPAPRRSIVPALASAAVLIMGATIGLALPVMHDRPSWRIVAETRSGDVYIAGAGSSCRAAARNAVLPEGWTRVTCERSRFFRN